MFISFFNVFHVFLCFFSFSHFFIQDQGDDPAAHARVLPASGWPERAWHGPQAEGDHPAAGDDEGLGDVPRGLELHQLGVGALALEPRGWPGGRVEGP